MSDLFIDPADQYSMQQLTGLQRRMEINPEADANVERGGMTIPPSELIMGAGKPYLASVAFVSADPKARWKYHAHKAGNPNAPFEKPFVGCSLQYTLQQTPRGQYDNLTITDYISTYEQRDKTNSAMAFLQACGRWDKNIVNSPQFQQNPHQVFMQLVNEAVAQTPVIGIHVNWRGQRAYQQHGPDGRPMTKENGDPVIMYEDVEGLESWRSFCSYGMIENIPVSRHECKKADGSPLTDSLGRPIVYTAKAYVSRKERVMVAAAPAQQQSGFAGGAFAPPPAQQFSGFATAAPMQNFPPPANYTMAPQPPQPQPPQQPIPFPGGGGYPGGHQPPAPPVQPPPQPNYPPAAAAPQQQQYTPPQPAGAPVYQAPQPTQPWQQQQPPAWVTGG